MTRLADLYPLWLRLWHWTNAVFFIVLIASGLSMHYSSPMNTILPFPTARILHNFTGVTLALAYIVFVLGNLLTANGKHYIPAWHELTHGLWTQLKFYLVGIFRGDPHPFTQGETGKFNPMQKITYLGIMYVAAPIVIMSGTLLLFPELAPRQMWNVAGFLPMAILHAAVGFMLSLFLVGHVYLASTGETLTANYKVMITGHHGIPVHHETEPSESPVQDVREGLDTSEPLELYPEESNPNDGADRGNSQVAR